MKKQNLSPIDVQLAEIFDYVADVLLEQNNPGYHNFILLLLRNGSEPTARSIYSNGKKFIELATGLRLEWKIKEDNEYFRITPSFVDLSENQQFSAVIKKLKKQLREKGILNKKGFVLARHLL